MKHPAKIMGYRIKFDVALWQSLKWYHKVAAILILPWLCWNAIKTKGVNEQLYNSYKKDLIDMEKKRKTCWSCGTEITNKCRKAKVPIQTSGRNVGKPFLCCEKPDFRNCPNPGCEARTIGVALICLNCGSYFGFETW